MAENFYTLVTQVGLAKITNAQLTSSKLDLTTIVVGDGNGAYYNPTSSTTSIKREVWRGAIGSIGVDESNPNWLVVETVVPATVGGFTVREVGLVDAVGDLIAIGKYPETYKPVLADGSTKDLYIRMIIEVSNASSVTLKVDPTIVIASRKYVDDKVAGSAGIINKAVKDIADGSITILPLQTTDKTLAGAINEINTGLTDHKKEGATTSKAGHVILSSAVTSADETKAATPNAIKKVNDAVGTLAGSGNTKTVKKIDDELTTVKENVVTHSAEVASQQKTGHMSSSDKTKLDGVEQGANNYTHPTTHPPSIISQDTNNRFMTDAERSKLQDVEVGANKYTHPSTHSATMITEDAAHRFVTDAEKENWKSKETPEAAQLKVNALAGAGNTKTVKQLDEALTIHSKEKTPHGIGSDPLETIAQTLRGAINETKSRADAAFTSASNGKSAVSAAITGVDEDVVIPDEPTFQQLVGAIGSININSYAEGSASVSNAAEPYRVANLTFVPDVVVYEYRTPSGIDYYRNGVSLRDSPTLFTRRGGHYGSEYAGNGGTGGAIVSRETIISGNGFVIPASGLGAINMVYWRAYKFERVDFI